MPPDRTSDEEQRQSADDQNDLSRVAAALGRLDEATSAVAQYVLEERRAAEALIAGAVAQFELRTGVTVTAIGVGAHLGGMPGASPTRPISITCILPIKGDAA